MRKRLIGIAVWKGGAWYLRRRVVRSRNTIAIGTVATIIALGVAAGVLAAERPKRRRCFW
jgi:hypothetical protein